MGSIRIDNSQNLINRTLLPLSPTQSTGAEQGPSVSSSSAASRKPTVNLFDQSSYQTTPAVTLTDGTSITLPTSTAEDAQTFQTLFAKIPDEHKAAINAASANIASAVLNYVQQSGGNTSANGVAGVTSNAGSAAIVNQAASVNTSSVGGANSVSKIAVGGVSKVASTIDGPSTQASAPVDGTTATTYTISQASPDVGGVHAAISSAATAYTAATGEGGYDSTVQAVAYMGVQGLQQSLGNYAQQMQGQINNQNTVRTDQSELANAVADWPSGTTTQTFTYHDVDANGNLQTYTADLTEDQAKAEASNLTNTLSSMGTDTQMMQMQLQNMEQNYQQGVTTISNIMNTQYQMVKNTIGNIHY